MTTRKKEQHLEKLMLTLELLDDSDFKGKIKGGANSQGYMQSGGVGVWKWVWESKSRYEAVAYDNAKDTTRSLQEAMFGGEATWDVWTLS